MNLPNVKGATVLDVVDLPGTIHPFFNKHLSLFETLTNELKSLSTEPQAKKIFLAAGANLFITIMLLFWCNSTNSMALTAYTYLTIFDIMSLMTCLVTYWVQKQQCSPIFSFGYDRFEVVSVFASTVLAQLGCLFIVKESVERMVEQPDVHTGRLMVGTLLAFCVHLMITYSIENKAFNHVISAASSSWLQEHVADMSQSLCYALPGLSKILLPRINPFSLIGVAGCCALITTYFLIDVYNYYSGDTWAAIWIALMTAGTMFPMSIYSGQILLQTTPSYIIGQLDKCLREASTLDGVLEFRNEHFWTVGFGTMAGSVHVRIRRDADEQMVLAHIMNRLCNVVKKLTIQVFKDDWVRTSAYQVLRESNISTKSRTENTTASSNLASKLTSGLPDSFLLANKQLDNPKNIVIPPVNVTKTPLAQSMPLSQKNLYSSPGILSQGATSTSRFSTNIGISQTTTPTDNNTHPYNTDLSHHSEGQHSHDHQSYSH